MMQLGFSFNLSRCSGCMACVVACMDQNDITGDDPSFRQVSRLEKGTYPSARMAFVSIACFHCTDAPCMQVCPRGAIFRTEEWGTVDVDEELCIGCRACAMVCPYGAPKFPQEAKMMKCNFCFERVTHGMEPACVRACPTKALGFGSMDELSRKSAEKVSERILQSYLVADPKGL